MLFYDTGQVLVDRKLIVAMDAAKEKSRTLANKALIFIRPKNNFLIMGRCVLVIFHDLLPMALLVSLSWYRFASSPGLPLITTVNPFR